MRLWRGRCGFKNTQTLDEEQESLDVELHDCKSHPSKQFRNILHVLLKAAKVD